MELNSICYLYSLTRCRTLCLFCLYKIPKKNSFLLPSCETLLDFKASKSKESKNWLQAPLDEKSARSVTRRIRGIGFAVFFNIFDYLMNYLKL